MIVFVVEQGFQNSKISCMLKEYSVLVKRNGKYEQIYGNNCIIEKVSFKIKRLYVLCYSIKWVGQQNTQ